MNTDELERLARRASGELADASALEILRWADHQFGPAWCVTSSMADAVLPHLASRVRRGVDVIFLDTGYHFAETTATRDTVAQTLPVTVRSVAPQQTVAQQDQQFGPRLHDRDPDLCCRLRKVIPLQAALGPYVAWTTGVRRDDSASRAHTRTVEWDARRGKVKLNPIAAWTQADVDAYLVEHAVPVNPLLADGYTSVGCAPCTRRTRPGEDPRAGRWAATDKTECGLHS